MTTFNEPISSYDVTQLHNDAVEYNQVVNLTLANGVKVFIAFPTAPPGDWLRSSQGWQVFLQRAQFEHVYRLLQTENPVYFTAINIIGIRAFNMRTLQETLGEGPADDDALVQLAQQLAASQEDSGG